MKPLESMAQHGPIRFFQDIPSDLDNKVGAYSKKEIIEGSVVQLAQGDAVSDDRIATRLIIWDDMCCIKQFPVSQAAKRTLFPVG